MLHILFFLNYIDELYALILHIDYRHFYPTYEINCLLLLVIVEKGALFRVFFVGDLFIILYCGGYLFIVFREYILGK